jgi:pimeloyl-ACP methyl ester carboxylesterase
MALGDDAAHAFDRGGVGMPGFTSRRTRIIVGALAAALVAVTIASTASAARPLLPVWLPGFAAPGTPSHLDKVGVLKIGSPLATNVLVLEPGTSAGAAYFVPFAKWLVEKAPGWQVWAVERRENLLEGQLELNRFKRGEVTPAAFFKFYLGYLGEEGTTEPHYRPISTHAAVTDGAREWGMNVAVEDLHVVIEAAKALGGKVVLGGHSLGGSVVTAYATWDFGGKPGADGLSGLVYDDGGSNPVPISEEEAKTSLNKLTLKSPWLAFGGIPAPTLGLFGMVGSALTVFAPNEEALFGKWPLLPSFLKTRNSKGEVVPSTNEAGFGYGVNVGTSPPNLAAAQVHAGAGIVEAGPGEPWVWNGSGAITPIRRYAEMLSGGSVQRADGEEWYFPERLTIDTGAVAEGNANPAQTLLGEHAIHGSELPTSLHILAINSELDKLIGPGFSSLKAAEILAEQSKIPSSNLTLVEEESTYAHNDPAGAYPENEFMNKLVPFLAGL